MRAGLWPDAAMPVQAMQDELREAVLVAERALLCALGFDLTLRRLPVQAMQDELREAVLVAERGGARAAVRAGL